MNTEENEKREVLGESKDMARVLGAGEELDAYLESISNMGITGICLYYPSGSWEAKHLYEHKISIKMYAEY